MADAAAALLDYLEIKRANIVKNSNSGAVVQTLAIGHPLYTATLISMMATSGRRGPARPSEAASGWLVRPWNPVGTRDGAQLVRFVADVTKQDDIENTVAVCPLTYQPFRMDNRSMALEMF